MLIMFLAAELDLDQTGTNEKEGLMALRRTWNRYCEDCGQDLTGQATNSHIWIKSCECKPPIPGPLPAPRMVKLSNLIDNKRT